MKPSDYTADRLLVRSPASPDEGFTGVIASVSPQQAGWELLNLEVRRLARGTTWSGATGGTETGLVVLGGRCQVTSSRGTWPEVGDRAHVFAGMAHALYLPRDTQFELTALTDLVEVAVCSVPTDEDHPARHVTPADVTIEIRGGHNATRQINPVFPPGFDCHRLVCVEVYTPGGNWSSYPPHKHDQHGVDDDGHLLEADLEEIYFYKFNRPAGFALQRVYTADGALDEVMIPHDNDIVLVPCGYHPVSAPYGYDCYYLNFLAGSAQSLASTDDPAHAWIKETWTGQDPRVPLVDRGMTRRRGDT